MAKTSRERYEDWKRRRDMGEEAPRCACGSLLNGKLSRERGICTRCWTKTPDWAIANREKTRKYRERKRQERQSQEQSQEQ